MSYVDKNLLPGETVTYRTCLHWKSLIGPYALALLVFLPLTIVAVIFSLIPLAIVPAAIGLIIVVIAHLRRNSSEFAVTNRRIIIKVGFMSTRSIELLLPKVEAITVNQTVAGRMFGYGDIIVTGSGGTKEPFAGIQSPLKFRQAVQAASAGATDSAVSSSSG